MNKWLRGTNAAVLSAAVIGIFIIATIFLNSVKGLQWDLTKNKKFTLSDQTISTLKSLDQDVHMLVFSGGNADPLMTRQVDDMVQEYKKRSSKITVDSYDIAKDPSMAKQYEVDPSGTIVFESGNQKKSVYFYDMFQQGQAQGEYQFSGEQKMTQAIVSITSKEKYPVYVLQGHQEIPMAQLGAFVNELEGENYVVKELNLLKEGKIPDDAKMLLVLGPQNDFNDKEAELIKEYLKGNGKLYIGLGFHKDMATKWKNIDSILATLGVQDSHAVAIDSKQTFDPLSIVTEYGAHSITEKLQQYDLITVLSLAIGLNADTAAAGDYTANPLLMSSSKAYGETDIETLFTQRKTNQNDKDLKGPLNLAYTIENKEQKPKAVVLGSSTFVTEQQQGGIYTAGNRDFALNSIGWLLEQKDSVTIRPRQEEAFQTATILPDQQNAIFYGTVFGFPALFLVIGGGIWWRRRKG